MYTEKIKLVIFSLLGSRFQGSQEIILDTHMFQGIRSLRENI
jgi:hypothetical protein